MLNYFTVYAKRINGNVEIYKDAACKNIVAHFSKHITTVPNKRRKQITLNSFKFNLQWV